MEKFGNFQFKITQNVGHSGWFYQIFNPNHSLRIESTEAFTNPRIARIAAIGHISLLERLND